MIKRAVFVSLQPSEQLVTQQTDTADPPPTPQFAVSPIRGFLCGTYVHFEENSPIRGTFH